MSLASGSVSRNVTQQSSVSSSNSSYQPATQQAGTSMLPRCSSHGLLRHLARQPKVKIHVDECVERRIGVARLVVDFVQRQMPGIDPVAVQGLAALPRPDQPGAEGCQPGDTGLSAAKSVSDHGRVDATQMRGSTDGCGKLREPGVRNPEHPHPARRPGLGGGPLDGVDAVRDLVGERLVAAFGRISAAHVLGDAHVPALREIAGDGWQVVQRRPLVVRTAIDGHRELAAGIGPVDIGSQDDTVAHGYRHVRFDDDFGIAHGGGEGDRLGRQHFPANALLLGKLLRPGGIGLPAKRLPLPFARMAVRFHPLSRFRTLRVICSTK